MVGVRRTAPPVVPTQLDDLKTSYADGLIELDEFERRAGDLIASGVENEPAGRRSELSERVEESAGQSGRASGAGALSGGAKVEYAPSSPATRSLSSSEKAVKKRRWRARRTPGYFRELDAARERKDRYRGTCLICGRSTDGSGGRAKAPKRCRECWDKRLSVPDPTSDG